MGDLERCDRSPSSSTFTLLLCVMAVGCSERLPPVDAHIPSEDGGVTLDAATVDDAGGGDAARADAHVDDGGADAGTPDAGPPAPRYVDVAVGYDHACAVDADGFVACWGRNHSAQVGLPSATDDPVLTPTRVDGIDGVSQVALGHAFSCALKQDGSVHCWGRAEMLGRASPNVPTPTRIPGLEGIEAIGAQRINACALTTMGDLFCWGENGNGQTISPTFVDVPTQVAGLGPVADVAVGAGHRCVRMAAGGVRCWGYGQAGRLGTGDEADQAAPEPISGLGTEPGVTAIAAGWSASCATVETEVRCWGGAGVARTEGFALSPVTLEGVGAARTISIGYAACAIEEGTSALRCWGSNSDGLLGVGDTEPTTDVVTPVGLPTASVVSVGAFATCAIHEGAVYCWGENSHGLVGDGSTDDRLVPTRILPR